MQPFDLGTPRFVLDQPAASDIDDIATYCADPVFESFMVTPWPYERSHAASFVEEYVPGGWDRGDEWTWAIREAPDGPLLGVVGVRLGTGMIGYWVGAPHRGRGVMPEAVDAVADAFFARTDADQMLWECVVGNEASRRVAEKSGFRMTGERPGTIPARGGSDAPAWTGVLTRDAHAARAAR